MGKTVDVTIPVESDVAPALADARNCQAIGGLASRILRPFAGPTALARAFPA